MSGDARAHTMVERQLKRRGITDRRVLDAMLVIPREDFVSDLFRFRAYDDAALPILFGQTISQPYITALMVQSLNLRGTERVLDVGTGSGYHAAVLGKLAAEVYTIERIPRLAAIARRNLRSAGLLSNIHVICGDGSQGYPQASPYDAISVAAGAPEVPPALIEQLNDPGTLVIPVGDREDQMLRVVRKENGRISTRTVERCRFVPLVGEQAWR